MKIFLIILSILFLLIFYLSTCKIKESTVLKTLNTFLKMPNITDTVYTEQINFFNFVLDHSEFIEFDVTGSNRLLRDICNILNHSTPINIRRNMIELLKNYK